MKTGRPTKYNDEILTKTEDYILNFKDHDDAIPSAAGLGCVLGVAKSTVYKWGDEYPEFSDALARLQQRQEKELLNGGLTNAMNSTITKLVLSNHSYSDKVESTVDHTTKGDKIGVPMHSFVSTDTDK
tara:strand:- start:300 stop:683 length:384 start_codon:yes stop_codon:yes gene_type:complete